MDFAHTVNTIPAIRTTTPRDQSLPAGVVAVTPRGLHLYYKSDNYPAAVILRDTLAKLPGWTAQIQDHVEF